MNINGEEKYCSLSPHSSAVCIQKVEWVVKEQFMFCLVGKHRPTSAHPSSQVVIGQKT